MGKNLNQEKVLIRLERYIKKHGAVKLASDLGYRSSQTPVMWIYRKRIPERRLMDVHVWLREVRDVG